MNKTFTGNSVFCILISVFLFALSGSRENGKNIEEPMVNKNSEIADDTVSFVKNDEEKKIDVYIGGEIFTSYMYSDMFKKPVLYPIKAAGGTIITRGFPLAPRPGESDDHPHHVGLWFNYGDVNGLDFWNNSDAVSAKRAEFYGTIIHKEVNSINNGNEKGELEVTMEWVGPEGEVLLTENTIFVFSGSDNKRTIDRITRLTALDKDVAMKDNKEGLLGIRMTRELEHPDQHDEATGIYRSSEGPEGNDVWGTRAKWVNLSGQINSENVSVAILDHPENVGYPAYWHARGYGLFAANPLGMKAMSGGKEELNFVLSAGKSVTFKHRIIIYSGEKTDDTVVNKDWEEFAH